MLTMLPAHRLIWSGSCVAALLAHAAMVLPWVWYRDDALAGAGGQQLDVISVTMVNPGVLESRELDQTKPIAPASAAAIETEEGAAALAQPETRKEETERPETKTPHDERTADAIIEVKPEAPKQPPAESAPVGGATARGDATTESKPTGPAAASAGAVREYARWVSQALAKTKPKGAGSHGTVRIKFMIAATGKLSLLEISKSSGNEKLDQKAIDAVQRAVFPAPPQGMTVGQLTYEIPYQFR